MLIKKDGRSQTRKFNNKRIRGAVFVRIPEPSSSSYFTRRLVRRVESVHAGRWRRRNAYFEIHGDCKHRRDGGIHSKSGYILYNAKNPFFNSLPSRPCE